MRLADHPSIASLVFAIFTLRGKSCDATPKLSEKRGWIMRRMFGLAACAALSFAIGPALNPAKADFASAQQDFDANLTVAQRIQAQVSLIATGHLVVVPADHFTASVYKAVAGFQAANGFSATGALTRPQYDRLLREGRAMLNAWGFGTITHPMRPVSIWAPVGLGMSVVQNASGLHYRDAQGRLELDFVSVPNRDVARVKHGLITDKRRDGSVIHYVSDKDDEGWFALSTSSPDGHDHYYRYHQDGSAVTGFALEWDNGAGNIHAERIAVIMSASLRAAMQGTPFIDPPVAQVAREEANPEPPTGRSAAVPVVPPAPGPEHHGTSSGSGFFVTDVGHLVTNAHVVKGCTAITVKTDDGTTAPAVELATDEANDLALLKTRVTPARVAPLRIGARQGEAVEAFGFPHADLLATTGNFTLGNVTALQGLGDDSRYLQISAPVQGSRPCRTGASSV